MRIQRFRTVPLLSITLISLGLVTTAKAYADDTQHAREHRREEQRNAREHRREAQRHANEGYYGNQQGYGNRGNDPYYRDPYSRNRTEAYTYGRGTYGTGRSGDVINRALSNLNVAARNSRVDGHERGHFNTAQQELSNFKRAGLRVSSTRVGWTKP